MTPGCQNSTSPMTLILGFSKIRTISSTSHAMSSFSNMTLSKLACAMRSCICCCKDFGPTLSSSPVVNLDLAGVAGVSKAGGGIPARVAGDPDAARVLCLPLGDCLDVLLAGELESALRRIDRGGEDISSLGRVISCLKSRVIFQPELSLGW